jgi:hypothetical protein
MIETLSCPNCGGSLPYKVIPGTVVPCEYCGTSFRVDMTLTPEPKMGDLLLGADFVNPEVPGWRVDNREMLVFKPGPPPELQVDHPKSDLIHPIVRTPAPFDDFDASVTIRFLEGDYESISAGFEVRSCDAGDYVIRISAQGTFQIGWHNKTDWGDYLLKWTSHPILKTKMGEANRLRAVLKGDQIRVYLNGVLTTSLRDDKFSSGTVRVVISPGQKSRIRVAFSDLQLREPPTD